MVRTSPAAIIAATACRAKPSPRASLRQKLVRTRSADRRLPDRSAIEASMRIRPTIMNSAKGEPIQKHVFGRMPFIGTAFHLESGEHVTARRVDVGKPALGKFIARVDVGDAEIVRFAASNACAVLTR